MAQGFRGVNARRPIDSRPSPPILGPPMLRFVSSLVLALCLGSASATTVLVLGDSLTAGLGVESDEAFPALLEEKAKAAGHTGVAVINAGVSGDTSAGGLRRLPWLLNREIDILILGLGANDGLRGISPETTARNLQAIIDTAKKKYPGLRVIVAGMRMPPNMGAEYEKSFEAVFPNIAETNGALLVPFLLDGVGGNVAMNQDDRIHPNAAGHRILAGNVWKVLGPLLKSMAAD